MDITKYSREQEIIVEKMQYNKKMKVVGKIFVSEKAEDLTQSQLETIWHLVNYGCWATRQDLYDVAGENDSPYLGYQYLTYNGIAYIPMSDINYCNRDIYVRQHYDVMHGWWLRRENHQDKWHFGARGEAITELAERIY